MEAIYKLRVECPYEILKIEDIKVEWKPNEHGCMKLKCLLDDSMKFKYSIEASTEDKICIYEELGNGEKAIIFNGLIQNVRTTNINGIYYLELDGVSSSFKLDIEEKSRSFQDTEMTYDELIEEILKDYKDFGYTQCMNEPKKIGKPIFQYKETDFDFLKRMASQLGIDLVCDIINFNNMFYFGRPEGEKYILEDEINYRAYKNLEKYFKVQQAFGIDFHDTDYFYYEVEKHEKMDIGDQVYFKQKDLYINQYSAKFHEGELIYTYRLCRKKGIWQEKIDNIKMQGISLEGKVLEVKEQLVKLHLDIDKEQNQDKAFWYTFAPPTGNVMYSMPLVGTNALLYFPNVNKVNPIVIGCVRKNGAACNKFSDVNNRYYTTEHKNQLAMVPQSISFTCSGNPGLNVTLDDDEGVTIKSDNNITLTAPNEVIMKTETKVTIKAVSKLEVQRENKQAGISLENDMYCFGDIVHENGSCTETYAPYQDNLIANAISNGYSVDELNSGNLLAAANGAKPASVIVPLTGIKKIVNPEDAGYLYAYEVERNYDAGMTSATFYGKGEGPSITIGGREFGIKGEVGKSAQGKNEKKAFEVKIGEFETGLGEIEYDNDFSIDTVKVKAEGKAGTEGLSVGAKFALVECDTPKVKIPIPFTNQNLEMGATGDLGSLGAELQVGNGEGFKAGVHYGVGAELSFDIKDKEE